LKEKEQYEAVLAELAVIEKQYGLSSRVIYERALCLMELGEFCRARRCINDFLAGAQLQKHNDSYHQYCQQLIAQRDAPLTVGNISEITGINLRKMIGQ